MIEINEDSTENNKKIKTKFEMRDKPLGNQKSKKKIIKMPYLKDMIKECDNILRDITL